MCFSFGCEAAEMVASMATLKTASRGAQKFATLCCGEAPQEFYLSLLRFCKNAAEFREAIPLEANGFTFLHRSHTLRRDRRRGNIRKFTSEDAAASADRRHDLPRGAPDDPARNRGSHPRDPAGGDYRRDELMRSGTRPAIAIRGRPSAIARCRRLRVPRSSSEFHRTRCQIAKA
jgi:hypothetical protein